MFTQCIRTNRLVFQAPAEGEQDPVFSFKCAVIRPTKWLSAALPDADPDYAAVFQCDVLSDTNDLDAEQIEKLVNYIEEIESVPISTLSSDAVTRYPYV